MPVNKRWKLEELQRELIDWPRFGDKFCIEYVLIPGVDDCEHAAQVAAFVRPLKSLAAARARAATRRPTCASGRW
jgi:adenine C2-methylase RlmN of 23S rRNA A2503 and tRNA A37